MNLLQTVRLYCRVAINALELAVILVLFTGCPPNPPPDDEVPVRPPHQQPSRPFADR